MQKKKLNTQGFAHLGLVLLALALIAVGGAGAVVYHVNHKTKTVATVSTSSTSPAPATTTPSPSPTPSPSLTPSPKPDPYVGWKSYKSKLGGISIKYPTSWTAPSEPNTTSILNGTAKVDVIIFQSPYENFDGLKLAVQISLIAATAKMTCVADLPIYKAQNVTIDSHHLMIVSTNNSNRIGTMYLTSATGLKVGDILQPCADTTYIKSPLPETKTLQLSASFVTPVPNTAGGIHPLTPLQYTDYPLVSQIVKSFESVKFN